MSNEPHLPGYNVDDDTHDDNDDVTHIDVVTGHSEPPTELVSSTSDGDAITSTAVSSPTRQDSTQSRSTPPNQQEAEEERPTVDATPTTPPLPERPAVDEFADSKISGLHAIFPGYDAAIL